VPEDADIRLYDKVQRQEAVRQLGISCLFLGHPHASGRRSRQRGVQPILPTAFRAHLSISLEDGSGSGAGGLGERENWFAVGPSRTLLLAKDLMPHYGYEPMTEANANLPDAAALAICAQRSAQAREQAWRRLARTTTTTMCCGDSGQIIFPARATASRIECLGIDGEVAKHPAARRNYKRR
jgi:hypothetical protein